MQEPASIEVSQKQYDKISIFIAKTPLDITTNFDKDIEIITPFLGDILAITESYKDGSVESSCRNSADCSKDRNYLTLTGIRLITLFLLIK